MATSLSIPVHEAFEAAKRDFYQNLKNAKDYDFSSSASIDDVYDTTDKIQTEQAKTGNMRYLNRIRPYLEVLSQYIGVLDTFSQVKADITSLIWGPIKFLLQISSNLIKSYDKIIDLMGQIGDRLPKFSRFAELFVSNGQIQHLLGVFFKDILDFHVISLNFFKLKKWNLFFESLWPKYGNKIIVVMANIERHAGLMIGEVTLTDITNAHLAREQAMEKYRRDEEFQRRQDFASVKQALSPNLYDDELTAFRRDRYPNAGGWLDSHEQFCQWLNPNSQSRLFWLKGIPGAGKTFLSSHIIDKAQVLDGSNVVFAFLSYKDSNITTVKIFQSFIFQLLQDNPHLQPVLSTEYHVNPRKVMSDTKHVQTLLKEILQAVNVTYIVIDGLDEINQIERQALLTDLLEINRASSDTKLLISSRVEHDILRLLPIDVEAGQVNDRNINDIKTYVQERSDWWLMSSGFDVETSAKIKEMLLPLASKSNGMILYARLIMDSLSFLGSLEDINQELSTLPNGLDQAYGRILKRIDEHSSQITRKQAKRILAWVGCSKIPMRKQEIEAALSIRDEDTAFPKNRRLSLNIPGICGPIIEIRNEVVQFVHFTAREYVFSSQNKTPLKSLDAHLDISKVCLNYLGFECFETQDPNDIEASILAGDYVIFHYVATQWIAQFLECVKFTKSFEELKDMCKKVEDLIQKWENANYNKASQCLKRNIMEFKALQENWPQICETLIPERSFWRFGAPFRSLVDDTVDCIDSSLAIFTVYMRVHCQLENLLCQGKYHNLGCRCRTLQDRYGQLIFKCNIFGCRFHRLGFETRLERDNHVKDHRNFKCPEVACQFSDIGFKSEIALRQHVRQIHQKEVESQGTFSVLDNIELKKVDSLLVDSVLAGEIDYVRRFLKSASDEASNEAYLTALRSSTVAMVELFITFGKDIDNVFKYDGSQYNYIPLIEAVKARNFETASLLLGRGCEVHRSQVIETFESALDCAMGIKYPDISFKFIYLLMSYGVDLSKRRKHLITLIPSGKKSDIQAIQMLENFKSAQRPRDNFSTLLKDVGSQNCSIEIAKYLLKNGADVNTRGSSPSEIFATPLYIAAQKPSKEAAEFAKLLLESGANPFLKVGGRLAGEQRGARNISKWLGVTWDELVESTASARNGNVSV